MFILICFIQFDDHQIFVTSLKLNQQNKNIKIIIFLFYLHTAKNVHKINVFLLLEKFFYITKKMKLFVTQFL